MIRPRFVCIFLFLCSTERFSSKEAIIAFFAVISYYTTNCSRIARGTTRRNGFPGKSAFSTKKDGKKPPFSVLSDFWKIGKIYCLVGAAVVVAAAVVSPAGAASERTPLRPAARPARPWISLGMMILVALPSAAFANASRLFN